MAVLKVTARSDYSIK